MKITRDNYEIFFLDYLDGNLEEQDMDQFLDFMEQNADLKEELRSLEQISLPEDMAVMPGKDKLYKIQEEEKPIADDKLVAYLEGDLEEGNRALFESYLATHPELRKEYTIFEKTRLKPDTSIRFAHKKKLYKKPASVIVMNWVARAAAVIVLAWGVSLLFRGQQSPKTILSTPEIAQVSPNPEPREKTAKTEPQPAKTKIQRETVYATAVAPNAEKTKPVQQKIVPEKHSEPLAQPVPAEREFLAMAEIQPLGAQLQKQQPEIQLAIARMPEIEPEQEPAREMDIPEFLADRAKRVGNEGVRSIQRLARLGLGLASEISGDRISYTENDGKIASVEFETKLLAFTIPLEKK